MKKNLGFLVIGLSIVAFCYVAYKYKNSEMIQELLVEKVEAVESSAPKMHKYRLNKLWRDNAAARLEREDGAIISRRILNDEEYSQQLGFKLMEEAQEVVSATTKDELMSEIGDVLDVLDCIMKHHNFSQEKIDIARELKKKERGGSYFNREYVMDVQAVDGSFLHNYYLQSPDRHPEILD